MGKWKGTIFYVTKMKIVWIDENIVSNRWDIDKVLKRSSSKIFTSSMAISAITSSPYKRGIY